MSKQHYTFIDLLRVIACFFVIVNHTNSDIFITLTPASRTWWISLGYFFLSKTAVPIFIMITGFNLLDRWESYRKNLLRLARVILVLLLYSLVYYIYQWRVGILVGASVGNFFLTVLNYYITNSFWYMYVYVGILIMLPFLRRMAQAMNKLDMCVFIGISVLIHGLLPILAHYFPKVSYSPMINLVIFDGCICFLILGYYLKKYASRSLLGMLLAIAGIILPLAYNIFMTKLEYDRSGGVSYLFYDNRELLPTVIQSVSIFYLAMCIDYGKASAAVLKTLGDCTFGIYLISDLVIARTYTIYNVFSGVIHRLPAMLLFELAVFAIGFGITFVLRLIPGMKKLL